MINIPLKVKHILRQLILRILLLLFLRPNIPRLLHLLILITVIVPTRALPMLLPISQTQPTKLMPTQLTSHMVTSLVLFNRLLTLGAALRIGQDPVNVLTFIRIFYPPGMSLLTGARLMRLVSALEAVPVAALAQNVRNTHILVLHAVVAPLKGTPSHILVIVSKGLTRPLSVSHKVISRQVFNENRMWYHHIAPKLRTLREDSL